jgi:hypothetical protein
VYAVTAPEAPPRWSAFCMEETVRLVVEAVPEYAMPETVETVEEAKVMVAEFAVMMPKVCVPAQVFEVVVPYATEKTPVPLLYCSGYEAESDPGAR